MITGNTRLLGLLGKPVRHSMSPLMHNEAFRILGLDYVYLCFEIGEEELPEAVRGLVRLGARGFNLTMPNKNRILPLLDRLSDEAELIGAVNTVVVEEDGRTTGYNTDGIGFVRSAAEKGCPVENSVITLMGAGGAATAVCAQAALSGASVIHQFVRRDSRFRPRAEALARKINAALPCRAVLHDHENMEELNECLAQSDLLINATSVGMAPDADRCILPEEIVLRRDLAVADIIYNPRETRLLSRARACGCLAFNGLDMLLYQGAEAFRLWTGQEMPAGPVRKIIENQQERK